jgi:hypothetical protein
MPPIELKEFAIGFANEQEKGPAFWGSEFTSNFCRKFIEGTVPLFVKKTIFPRVISKELEDALISFLNKLAAPPGKAGWRKKFWDALSAPFVVTLWGGLALAVVSAVFARTTADNLNPTMRLRAKRRFTVPYHGFSS